MFELSVLSSGSTANATLVCSGDRRILIDCGLGYKALNTRIKEIGKDPTEITDIIITHEHRDHIHGVCKVARKTGARIWVNEETGRAWREFHTDPPARRSFFNNSESFQIGELEITPFSISHDAVDPVGFRISSAEGSIGYCTDLGHVTSKVRESLRGLDALILESNHDPSLLSTAPYPAELKARISSNRGHLSNHVAAALLEELLNEEGSRLRFVVAGHVSQKANDPYIVRDTLNEAIQKAAREGQQVELIVACAYRPTDPWNSRASTKMTPSTKSATSHIEQLLELF